MAMRAVPPPEPPPAPQTPLFAPTLERDPVDFDIAPPDLGRWAWLIYTAVAVFCLVAWIPLGALLWAAGRWCAQRMGLA